MLGDVLSAQGRIVNVCASRFFAAEEGKLLAVEVFVQ
jgi:hypothetical protein